MSDPEITVPIEEPVELEILFHDLCSDMQESIADIMGCEVHEVIGHTNWDVFPMAHIFIHPLTEKENQNG